jgi:phosphoribulokinase
MRPSAQDDISSGHYRAVLAEAAGRVVRKELAALTRAARRAGDDFEAFEADVNEFYATHAEFAAQALRMPVSTARMYVQAQRALALRFGTPAVTLDEAAAVSVLMALAMEGEHVLE